MDLKRLETVLDGAAVLGAELEPRFRVLAMTLEPTADRWPQPDDRRVQVLCFPVSTILASLRRLTDEDPTLLTFEIDALADVVAAFGGACVSAPLFGRPEPRQGQWGPRYSLEGRSNAPDGTRTTITVGLRAEDLELDLFARFDDVEVRDANGDRVAL